jgi:hypothetical protein
VEREKEEAKRKEFDKKLGEVREDSNDKSDAENTGEKPSITGKNEETNIYKQQKVVFCANAYE